MSTVWPPHKAVIPVVGRSTRFPPVTSAVPEELLVLDRPTLQRIAAETADLVVDLRAVACGPSSPDVRRWLADFAAGQG
jgi:UTP-glucose-1-phosphate uridylyltransferase